MVHQQQNLVRSVPERIGHYIAGFVDGEGSFNVSLAKITWSRGWKILASFNVSQRDRVVLAKIKDTLRCGTLRTRADGVVYYEVTNFRSLAETVVPFFQRFGFLSATKKRNFAIWSQIVFILYRGEHLTREGFAKVVALREQLNVGRGRKRKYDINSVFRQRGSSETTRETRPAPEA
ncbi:MAG: hypothetical protein A3B37_03140 [Candidatus Sungbacteria bacterium RIFCSPLOWO2_01_FULL_59_16]|uniref:Homing endonuclease LAGLIDADG domain-containing protein n=1 Tax=Candidatus Sungbacteria bacterium RIFCSPLOWO2_01_FULL_59_16 TaxID=1802280 RepID=A0A1G2L9C4_9BACT|nr:MAG: hypothetical protein A3B37_03140 [Candidatus Sungbacteria bacterium RIFCSPLOWO2_01_FULL_59_16]